MALRIFQFSTLFTIGYSLGIRPDTSINGPGEFPTIDLTLNVTDPEDVVVQGGQSASLKCSAVSSDDDMKFAWIRNGVPLRKNDSRWIVQPDGTLHMPKVIAGRKANGVVGEYQCQVTNRDGTILTNPARVKTASIESEFSTHPANQIVPESQTVVLECSIHSTPPVEIHWEFNNLTLPHDNRYVPLPYGALIIQDSQSSDSGLYRCRATNDLLNKTRYSKEAVVSITAPETNAKEPIILPLDVSLNKTILLGGNLTLYCAVIGWPKVSIQWFNDRNMLISNGISLNITNASLDFAGNYTCIAHNTVGHAKRQFRLDVHQKPQIIQSPISKSSPPSSTVRLNCTVAGVPEPKIMWLKNGKLLNFSSRIKKQYRGLIFSHTFPSDSGFYQCVAINSAGRVWTAARILINHHLQPSPPGNVQCRPFNSTSICLNWTTTATVKAYTIYSVYKNEDGIEQGGPVAISNVTYCLIEGLTSTMSYTFYILSFADAASNASETVTCTPDKTTNRILNIQLNKSDSVLVKWNEISTDRHCTGERQSYKVQWREKVQGSVYFERTKLQQLLVTGLLPMVYEFRVTTMYDPEPEWVIFTIPLDKNHSNASSTSALHHNTSLPMSPTKFKGVATSGSSVLLDWVNIDTTVKFYDVCFFPMNEKKIECDDGNRLKSYKNDLKIDGLKPNTTYEFKVRAVNIDHKPGPYSQSIEIHTPENVPSAVQELSYRIINGSSICLHWQEPQRKNGMLQSYIISYTPDKNWPLENWLKISVPPYRQTEKSCWIDEKEWLKTKPDTISIILGNLTSEIQYMLLVRAVSEVGIGDPTFPIIISTQINEPLDQTGSVNKQKLGIILGVIVVLICILVCITCVLLRRRCLKRRVLARARRTNSNHLYPAVAHYATHVDSVQVRLEDTCAQESQHLVQDTLTTNIPPITTNHIDTKGGDEFPNGHVNGSAKPFMNGSLSKKPVHIRDNPQYYAYQSNGHTGGRKPFRFEEDSNSNVKPSKFYSIQRLFESSKKAGSSKYNQCNASENNDKYLQSSDDETPNEYDSLNVTRITCLDDSFGLNVNNNKRASPILEPNG